MLSAREHFLTKKDRNPEISVFFCINSKSSLEISNPNGDFGLKAELNLVDKPEAQYYCYLKAYSGSFDDEKGQELLDIEDL